MLSELVKDHMTANPVTISENASLEDAWELLEKSKFHHLPVLDQNNSPSGMLSSTDIRNFRKLFTLMENNYKSVAANLTVRDVMTTPVKSITPTAEVQEANDMMLRENIRALTVIEHGEVIGIISETDILRYYNLKYN